MGVDYRVRDVFLSNRPEEMMWFKRREDTPEQAARRLRFAVIAALRVGYVEGDVVRLVRRSLNDAKLLEKL